MKLETFLDSRVTLWAGDCLEVLRGRDAGQIDSVVTDPPYHLTSIVKRYSKGDAKTERSIGKLGTQGVSPYMRGARGFMGKQWDGGDIAFQPELWAEVLRVLKPGAHLVAFGGTRTYHRMACAIEDAGFEIRDQIGWAYGSGFPKSHDAGNGWGTALKPAWEPIVLARKPLTGTVAANVLAHGTGALNIDGCRVATDVDDPNNRVNPTKSNGLNSCFGVGDVPYARGPAHLGRWPANVIHDGSDEVVGAFPESTSVGHHPAARGVGGIGNDGHRGQSDLAERIGDTGSAARFFYTAKADADDRLGSKHPTVKPVDLMQWLVRLVTPKGGLVLDPFAGTGTTGEAAWREGMSAVLIEREAEYQADIRRRMKLAMSGPAERGRESVKAKGTADDAGPLFR